MLNIATKLGLTALVLGGSIAGGAGLSSISKKKVSLAPKNWSNLNILLSWGGLGKLEGVKLSENSDNYLVLFADNINCDGHVDESKTEKIWGDKVQIKPLKSSNDVKCFELL